MRALPVLRKRAFLALVTVGLCAGCGTAPAGTPPQRLALLVDASANEVQPGLTRGVGDLIEQAIASDHAVLDVVVGGEQTGGPIDLVPRRGSQVEHAEQRRGELTREIVATVRATVRDAASTSGRVDTLGQLTWLGRQSGEVTGILVGSGLQSVGPLAINALGWDAVGSDPVLEQADLPDLTGKTVVFSGIGDTAGNQPTLPESLRERLAEHWLRLCERAGGTCSVDDEPLTGAPRSTVPAPIVPVPEDPPIIMPTRANPTPTVTELPSDLFFAPDSAELLPEARDLLGEVAGRLPAGAVLTLDGRTASVGPAEGARALSLSRAEACRAALTAAGVPASTITVRGLGFDAPLDPDLDAQGRLIPAAAQRNRSVTLTVAIGDQP